MKHTLKKAGWLDAVVIILLLVLGTISLPLVYSHTPRMVMIFRNNRRIAGYPLGENRIVRLEGVRGTMVISIRDSGVRVDSADCPHRICMHGGTIRQAGQQLVCVPNHILIQVMPRTEQEKIDAVSR